jgi:predicted transcriptional regulator
MINDTINNNFFGRSDILEIIEKRVKHFGEGYRQNIALIGRELSGKTSLLKYFLSKFKDEQIIHLYLELSTNDLKVFIRKLSGGLLFNFLSSKDLEVRDDFNYLIDKSKAFVPKTAQHIMKINSDLDKERFTDAYREMLCLPEIFISETGKLCLIVIDEFQKLEDMKITNPYQELGKKIIAQKNCMFIFSSSNEVRARQILAEDLSLLFGNFEILSVSNFDVKTSYDFIHQILKEINLKTEHRNFIINFTGGNPFYLKILSEKLLELIKDEFIKDVTLPILVECLKLVLFDEWGQLNRYFMNYIEKLTLGRNNRIYIDTLLAIANGRRKIKEITDSVHKDKKDTSLNINRLLELNFISKNINSYYIHDRIFSFWLRYVFQKKLLSVSQDQEEAESLFRKNTEELIRNFVEISEKETSDRIVELFNLFTTETLQLDGHRYRFSTFREVKPIIFNGKEDSVLKGAMAYSRDSLWFILLKEDHFIEEDVMSFLSECRKHKFSPQRRIIISLGETDSNAKLRALKEKIWVWDLADLNTVLNLYDRPFIVK